MEAGECYPLAGCSHQEEIVVVDVLAGSRLLMMASHDVM